MTMNKILAAIEILFLSASVLVISCSNPQNKTPDEILISEIALKRGDIIVCGPSDKEFGTVSFETTCSEKVQATFDLAVALLHSFEYDEAEKVFAKIIDEEPECAMAYWGVAMANYHPLWEAPSQAELEKGTKTIAIASSLEQKSAIEKDYIDAVATFYKDWNTIDHRTRGLRYANAMEKVYTKYPQSREAALFYSLALIATADPSDKTRANQRKAGDILTALYPEGARHPGVVHYIIHTYDYPELAELALPAARKYASIAPSSAHAQHMPSHIFTRLGLWDECIQSNMVSASSAKCYAENAGITGHWDEELHGMDYMMYGYLQKGDNESANELYDYLKSIKEVYPLSFKAAYAFAAIPSRYYVENKLWKEAASLKIHPTNFPWENFPWQRSIFHFARLLGFVHVDHLDSAKSELTSLKNLYDILVNENDSYKANQVMIEIEAGTAWIMFKEGNKSDAIRFMTSAADREERTEKHPVTPGTVIPARELLGDMLIQMNNPKEAIVAYETDLKNQPNRFNGLYGAALSCERINHVEEATRYYQQLLSIANSPSANRPEVDKAKLFLKNQNIKL